MGQLMSDELDRDRPLWEMWLVDGLSRGRWALISKVHHCMVDGISGTDVMMAILDVAADAPIVPPPTWTPRREPGGVRLTVDALAGLATVPARHAFTMLRGVTTPRRALDGVRDTLVGLRVVRRPSDGTRRAAVDRRVDRQPATVGRGSLHAGRRQGDPPGSRWVRERRRPRGHHRVRSARC